MANLNTVDKKVKNSTVFTPKELSYYLYKLVTDAYDFKTILDPCIGANGGMTKYYYENDYEVIGADIDADGTNHCHTFFHQNIKESDIPDDVKPDLIVINPPFNGNGKGKNLLYPHLFLKTMFDRFGEDIPLVMITGDNFLNNNRMQSSRLKDISDADYDITSIVTLPLDVFPGVQFNTQVLFFNMPKLKAHYVFDISKVTLPNDDVNNNLEVMPTIGLVPFEEKKIDLNTLISDAAAELSISKNEVKTLVQKEKIQSVLRDGHYYVNIEEIQTYLTELELEPLVTSHVVTKTEEEKAELLQRFSLDIKKIDSKIKTLSGNKPVNSASNYTGGKEELYQQIVPYLKSNIATFYDIFGGGGIMSLNVEAQHSFYNEVITDQCNLLDKLSQNSAEENYKEVFSVIDEYKLSTDNEEGYYKLRADFNASKEKPWAMFYSLVLYSYRNMLSYNTDEEFNKSPGARHFNDSLKGKFILYTDKLIANRHRMTFQNKCYSFIDTHEFKENDFVYVDPPYFISDNKYGVKWEEEEEKALLKSLDSLHERNVNFALSNFIHDNGNTNQILIDWAEKNDDYNVIYLSKSYEDQKRIKVEGAITVEVLITNYKTLNSQEVHEVTMMDSEIVQGRFVVDNSLDIDNEVKNINKYFELSEEADKNFLLSMKKAFEEKCIGLVNKVKVGQELIVFQEKCFADGKVYKDEFQKQGFGFHLETARAYMKLARDERITKLTVEDMIKFKRKSLDALHDMTFLTDDEFNLFMNGRYEILKPRRKIAKSRQKPSKAKNDVITADNTLNAPDSAESADSVNISVLNQSDTSQEDVIAELKATIEKQNSVIEEQKAKIDEYERVIASNSISTLSAQNNILQESNKHSAEAFVNNTSLSDEHYKEILALDKAQLQKQHIQLASTEYLILGNSSISSFPFVMAS